MSGIDLSCPKCGYEDFFILVDLVVQRTFNRCKVHHPAIEEMAEEEEIDPQYAKSVMLSPSRQRDLIVDYDWDYSDEDSSVFEKVTLLECCQCNYRITDPEILKQMTYQDVT